MEELLLPRLLHELGRAGRPRPWPCGARAGSGHRGAVSPLVRIRLAKGGRVAGAAVGTPRPMSAAGQGSPLPLAPCLLQSCARAGTRGLGAEDALQAAPLLREARRACHSLRLGSAAIAAPLKLLWDHAGGRVLLLWG